MAAAALEFSKVTLIFDDVVGLENLSFRVEAGESLVVLGVTGSGKSVLLKLSLGLYKPDGGQIYLFGEQVSGIHEADLLGLRRRVGMVFQEGALFDSLTVADNVAYPLLNQEGAAPPGADVEERVREALRFVELEHAIDKLPSELSGGMRRRVAIARAIVNRPPLVLYDSPTAGLDPITAHTIMSLILKERDTAGATSVVVTHRLQDGHLLSKFRYDAARGEVVAAHGSSDGGSRTQVLVLQKGRQVFFGPQDELEKQQDPYLRKFVLKSQ